MKKKDSRGKLKGEAGQRLRITASSINEKKNNNTKARQSQERRSSHSPSHSAPDTAKRKMTSILLWERGGGWVIGN